MKMKKQLLALLLAAVMVFSLTGCIKHIASYLWITPQSLSRIRAKIASSSL